jgi:hypothetical protein
MSTVQEQVSEAVDEAVRLGLTAFEASVIAQLAKVDGAEATWELRSLHFRDQQQLEIEYLITCPNAACATQLNVGSALSAGDEHICPFCSARLVIEQGARLHELYVPRGQLAIPSPRHVSFRPHHRSRLSSLANPSIERLTRCQPAGMMQ